MSSADVGEAVAAATGKISADAEATRRQLKEVQGQLGVTEDAALGILRVLGLADAPPTRLPQALAEAAAGYLARRAAEIQQAAAERVKQRASIRELVEQVRQSGIRAGGVLDNAKQWPAGSTLRFCFLDGDAEQRQRAASVAREWSLYANLDLDFGLRNLPRDCPTQAADGALLRVTLNGQGNWAYVGIDAQLVSQLQPQVSITLRKLQDAADPAQLNRMILHEFGHVLGFIHAFSNPKARCAEQVDWERALRWGVARGLSSEATRFLLAAPRPERLAAGDVDPESVMTYVLPAEIFIAGAAADCVHTPGPGLSLGDKLAALEAYP
jgi:hypothetical protein